MENPNGQILEVSISNELSDTLNLALSISGDNRDEVFARLIQKYALDVLQQATTQQSKSKVQVQDSPLAMTPQNFHSKAYNRFARWVRKSHQTNHQIIKAFFICEENGTASRDEMCAAFMRNNPGRAPYFFENNLNSMATDAGNSHGKCFDIIGDIVKFTDEIAPLANEYRDYFVLEGLQ